MALDRFTGLALPFHLQIIAAHTKTILQLLESPQPILVWQVNKIEYRQKNTNTTETKGTQKLFKASSIHLFLIVQEVERASKSVRKLGSLLFEMEVEVISIFFNDNLMMITCKSVPGSPILPGKQFRPSIFRLAGQPWQDPGRPLHSQTQG